MTAKDYDIKGADIAWCPGCGNFAILDALKSALASLKIDPTRLVICSGIGQAAKLPQYLRCHYFNGLHGRSLPPATAVKMANPELTVMAVSGDGCTYGEGGNHFIHTIRRNPDITNIVHNNMIYGLTKGQASPTSLQGMKTGVQTNGVVSEPFNPLATAIALDAPFVARAFAGDKEHVADVISRAIQHPGYALVDILQPCVTFNKLNTYKWFKDHTYQLEDTHDRENRMAALARSLETDYLPLGVFYEHTKRKPLETSIPSYHEDQLPLYRRQEDRTKKLVKIMHEKN
jgi:2-oxoglutarate/2-oxoacid ferredoxin oxidoreductase subunit beta